MVVARGVVDTSQSVYSKRVSVQELAAMSERAESKKTEADHASRDLSVREGALQAREEELAAARADIRERERAMAERERSITDRERALEARGGESEAARNLLEARAREVENRERKVRGYVEEADRNVRGAQDRLKDVRRDIEEAEASRADAEAAAAAAERRTQDLEGKSTTLAEDRLVWWYNRIPCGCHVERKPFRLDCTICNLFKYRLNWLEWSSTLATRPTETRQTVCFLQALAADRARLEQRVAKVAEQELEVSQARREVEQARADLADSRMEQERVESELQVPLVFLQCSVPTC